MAQIQTRRGITIEYDGFGSPQDPALLLVMGYGAQLIRRRRAERARCLLRPN